MLRDGHVSARAFASKLIHGRRVIRLAKTCGELTASPYIRAGRLGYYGGVYENQDAYMVNLELPGLSQEDVKVTQTNNILTVRGAQHFKKAHDEAVYHSSERSYGTFERLFPLPG